MNNYVYLHVKNLSMFSKIHNMCPVLVLVCFRGMEVNTWEYLFKIVWFGFAGFLAFIPINAKIWDN